MDMMVVDFKSTEVGSIPTDWNIAMLGDYCVKIGSGITPTGGQKVYKEEGHHFIRSQNIGWGKLILDDIAFIDESTHQSFASTEIYPGDVFLNITGASIGRSAVATLQVVGGNVNQHVCIIRTNKEKLNPVFLNHFLLSKTGQRQIDSFQSGGNRQGLNIGQLKSFQLPLPSIEEQTAIAEALNDADSLIVSLEKLIAKKRFIKEGVWQNLLIPKEDWSRVKVSDLGYQYGGLSGKSRNDFGNGVAFYIPFMNIMSNAIIDLKNVERVRIKSGESQNPVKKGDLFFNGSSETPDEVGMCAVLMDDVENLYLNSFCFGFRLKSESQLNGLFLAYLFRSSFGRQIFFSLAQGATRYNLSKSNFLKLEIDLPSFSEQNRITGILNAIENEIAVLERKLSKQRLLKKGMMQNLLTGKIRLV